MKKQPQDTKLPMANSQNTRKTSTKTRLDHDFEPSKSTKPEFTTRKQGDSILKRTIAMKPTRVTADTQKTNPIAVAANVSQETEQKQEAEVTPVIETRADLRSKDTEVVADILPEVISEARRQDDLAPENVVSASQQIGTQTFVNGITDIFNNLKSFCAMAVHNVYSADVSQQTKSDIDTQNAGLELRHSDRIIKKTLANVESDIDTQNADLESKLLNRKKQHELSQKADILPKQDVDVKPELQKQELEVTSKIKDDSALIISQLDSDYYKLYDSSNQVPELKRKPHRKSRCKIY